MKDLNKSLGVKKIETTCGKHIHGRCAHKINYFFFISFQEIKTHSVPNFRKKNILMNRAIAKKKHCVDNEFQEEQKKNTNKDVTQFTNQNNSKSVTNIFDH